MDLYDGLKNEDYDLSMVIKSASKMSRNKFSLSLLFFIFVSINFLDLNIGPIISNNLPPIAEEILKPNILNKKKKIIKNKNWKKYLTIFIFL